MNKKLMAIAVAGALGAPVAAHAQSANFQIYGVMDLSVERVDWKSTGSQAATTAASATSVAAVGEQKKTDIYSQSSRIGFRGTEDLGGGLKAWFQVENGVDADGRKNNNNNDAGWGSRNTGAGLQGGFGQVLFGNWDSPYRAELIRTMTPYGNGWAGSNGMILGGNADATGTQPNVGCDNTFTATSTVTTGTSTTANSAAVCQMAEGGATSFHRRLANVAQYWTPNMAGFSGKFAYETTGSRTDSVTATGGNVVTNNPRLYALSATYDQGPLNVGIAREVHHGFRATGIGATSTAGVSQNSDAKDIGTLLYFSWDFKVVKLQFNHEQLQYGDTMQGAALSGPPFGGLVTPGSNNFKRKGDFLGLSAPVGNGLIKFGYSRTKGNEACGSLGIGAQNTAATSPTGQLNGQFFCGNDTGAKAIQLGYEHNLSKRTALYVQYMKVDNKALANFQPVVNKANVNGVAGTSITGQDVVILATGIKHSF